MASNYWAKLWIEMLDDPKVARLDDHLWRRWVEVILLAAELDQGGRLPAWESISDRLHIKLTEVDHLIDEFRDRGLLSVEEYNFIPHFDRFACGPDPYARASDWELRRRAVLERDHYTCRYCRAPAVHVDHVIPRCQDGSDELDNLVAACKHCNLSKGGRTPEQAGMELIV